MHVMQVLSALLIFSLFENGISQDNSCCAAKSVGGVEYRLINADGPTDGLNCINNCVYEQFGVPGSSFCFAKGNNSVICLQQKIIEFTVDCGKNIVESINEEYLKLDVETSVTVEKKLENFLKEMTDKTGLDPSSTDPFQSALKEAQNDFFGMPGANIEAINKGLNQIESDVKTIMSSKSVTLQDVKDKVEDLAKVVHRVYSDGEMYNCLYGLSLITLKVLETMATLFLPVAQGGQGAVKTLFDAMYANSGSVAPPYEEPECCGYVVRAWQGSSGAIMDGLINKTRSAFPNVKNFNDFPVSKFVPLEPEFLKVGIETGELGSRIIATDIFKF